VSSSSVPRSDGSPAAQRLATRSVTIAGLMVKWRGSVGAGFGCVAAMTLALGLAAPRAARAAASFQPAVSASVFDASGDLHVFWQGADGGISTAVRGASGVWTGPATIPGSAGAVASAPTATVSRGGGEIEVFWESRDGGVEESVFNVAGWSPAPIEIPNTAGQVTAAPTAMTWRDGEEIDLYWRASDGTIDEVYSHPWSGAWSTLRKPGVSFPAGAAISSTIGSGVYGRDIYVNLYWMGSDGGIWEASFRDSTGWSPDAREIAPAGSSTSAPAVTEALGDTAQQIYFRGAQGEIENTTYVSGSGSWPAPTAVPGTAAAPATSAPAAAFDEETLTTQLLWESAGGQIWRTVNAPGQGWLASPLADVPMTPPQALGHPVLTGTAPITVVPHRRHGHVNVKVIARWHWFPTRTRLRSLGLVKLPRHATVRLSCSGRRCPSSHYVGRSGHLATFRHRVSGATFAAGDRLVLTISVSHRRPERVRIRIRAGRKPLMRLR
jgi:hypothetical protein